MRQKRLIIWAAKGMFKSAYKLATLIKPETDRKVLVVRSDSLRFKLKLQDKLINWGNSKTADWLFNPYGVEPINNEHYVLNAVNKLLTFQILKGKVNIPEWTTDIKIADMWVEKGFMVVERHVLTGFGGKGIMLVGDPKKHPQVNDWYLGKAPLYVQYKKKAAEYRVHVFNGEVIDISQKKKRKDFKGEVNTSIRNYANGWVYCREDIVEPKDLRDQAGFAVEALQLDFGAVDIIYNKKEDKCYVLEVNTAPGMEGTTLQRYKDAILKGIKE